MGLLEKIKKDRVAAIKDGNKFKAVKLGNIIGTVQNAMSRPKHGTEEEEVLSAINKFIKGIDETFDKVGDKLTEDEAIDLRAEKAILIWYLPSQLNSEDLENLIMGFVAEGMDNVGMIMSTLKDMYSGQYNGKQASVIAKKLLDEHKVV